VAGGCGNYHGQTGKKGGDGHRAANDESKKGGEGRSSGRAIDRWQPMLLRHHGLDPALALGCDDFDRGVKSFALEAFGAKDLPDLLALALRRLFDVTLFHEADMLIFL